jgi:signal transduction histidine kinase
VRDKAWSWLRRNAADALIVALGVATEIELLVTSNDKLDKATTAPLGLFFFLPLLGRRRWPLPSVLTVFVALFVAQTFDNDGLGVVVTPFFAAIVAAVSAGAIADRRQASAGLAAIIALVVYIAETDPEGGFDDLLFLSVFFIAAWVGGVTISTRTRQASELRARAERAEIERERLTAEAVGEERARIARELHDVVAHSVSVMVVQAAGVRRLLKPEQEREREALLVVERIGREALTEMRRMLGVLRSTGDGPALAPQPGLQHLDRLVEQVRRAGVEVELVVNGEPVTLPPGIDLSAYRIVQEGLTNVLKHGDRRSAQVCVRYSDDQLELEVVDDSTMAVGDDAAGHGLAGMRERVAVYGGDFEAGPRPEGGFRVRARLPIGGAR